MEPTIIQLEPYGDHRDNKSNTYQYPLNFAAIIYNLTDEDAAFILLALHKNILFVNDGYDTITHYGIWERGTERWAEVIMQDKAKTLKQKRFTIWTDSSSRQLRIYIDHHNHADASACIMIYEYFLSKRNKILALEGKRIVTMDGFDYIIKEKQVESGDLIVQGTTMREACMADIDDTRDVLVSTTNPKYKAMIDNKKDVDSF